MAGNAAGAAGSEEEGQMKRRLSEKAMRIALWIAADGRCQICGDPLPENWHADHIVPWSVHRETNVHEMQALCPKCNLRKGSTHMKFRDFQAEFDGLVRRQAEENIKTIVANVTPGGGKSLLPVIAGMHLIPSVADKILWVVPRNNLRTQAVQQFAATQLSLNHSLSIRAAGNDYNPSRDCNGYVTTYQSIKTVPALHEHELSRFKYILVLDECHHLYEGGSWYDPIVPLVDKCCFLLLMSGGMDRGDKLQVAFFPYGADGRVIVEDEPPHRRVIEYGRKDALKENAIVPVEFRHLDGKAKWVNDLGKEVLIESIAETEGTEGRKALWTALNTDYANQLLKQTVEHFQGHRCINSWAQLLVIAPNIRSANQYADYVRRLTGIDVLIAHSDDEESEKNIRMMRDGKATAIVTVAMAYEGMDAPRITHIGALTYYRTKPWIDQMIARGVRRYKNKSRCYVFCPDDPMLVEIIELIRQEQVIPADETLTPKGPRPGPGLGVDPWPGPEGPVLGPGGIVPIDSIATDMRISELDAIGEEAANATPGQIAQMQQWGLEATSFCDVMLAIKKVGSAVPEIDVPDISLPVRNYETDMRSAIEVRCRSIDKQRNVPFGTTNAEVKRKFGKGRDLMGQRELAMVWAYLCKFYPMSA
jgi:superfamily II DNA or RNA helicase